MKTVKLDSEYYLLTDDKVSVDDWCFDSYHKTVFQSAFDESSLYHGLDGKRTIFKIIASTKELAIRVCLFARTEIKDKNNQTTSILPLLNLDQIEKLLGLFNLRKLANDVFDNRKKYIAIPHHFEITRDVFVENFMLGYNSSLENDKEKKFTYKQMQDSFEAGEARNDYFRSKDYKGEAPPKFNAFMENITYEKTEWETEIELTQATASALLCGYVRKPVMVNGFVNILKMA